LAATRTGLADHFNLTEEDRAERIPSGRVTTLQNRVGWAAMYLFRAGLLERPRRAHYRITERGHEMLSQHPDRIDLSVLNQFEEFAEFRKPSTSGLPSEEGEQVDTDSATAEERIDVGYRELRGALVADLLDRVREQSWEFFERLVLEVLKAMGYGGPEGAVERLGGQGGDEGVDGVIREDPLGLELIYIQAKSWANTVGRPEIQQFIGALQGKQASKGIFITTSKFSDEALAYARSVAVRVILIDGRRLAELMIDHNVGVNTRETYELKEVDLSYFLPEEGVNAS
ncbi:MAG TPA: restriction endonuclease, partial [Solirubrobacterales bacterium]|nr:restriction endonuclease [Solirubrobacterales bacterium]